MNWTQICDPLGLWPLSSLGAALPVMTLFYLLAVRGTRPHIAAAVSIRLLFQTAR
jgi:lactate permease